MQPLQLPQPALDFLLRALSSSDTLALALVSREYYEALASSPPVRRYRCYARFLRRFLLPTLQQSNTGMYFYFVVPGGTKPLELELYTIKEEYLPYQASHLLVANAYLLGQPAELARSLCDSVAGAWLPLDGRDEPNVVRGFELDLISLLEFLIDSALVRLDSVSFYAPSGPARDALKALSARFANGDWANIDAAGFWLLLEQVVNAPTWQAVDGNEV